LGDVSFTDLLPYIPGIPGFALAVVYFRFWTIAVRQLRTEQQRNDTLQRDIDTVREARRRMEDRVDQLTWEVRALKAEVARLRAQLGEVA